MKYPYESVVLNEEIPIFILINRWKRSSFKRMTTKTHEEEGE